MPFFCLIPRRRSSASRWLRPPFPPAKRAVNTRPLNVRERRGRGPVAGAGGAEGGEHGRAGDPGVGGDRQGVPGVVVEPGQDLGVLAAGERVVVKSDCQHSFGMSAWNRR